MKILVFGSDGFIGRNVCKELDKGHNVIRAVRGNVASSDTVQVDLLNQDSIGIALKKVCPDIIINCAGVVDASMDVEQNVQFTKNILEQAARTGGVKRVIISGSAGEYGRVSPENIPVNENTPLNADSGYGFSKLKEERLALELSQKHKINVVVLRIFNPIGKDMADRFLIMRLLQQLKEYQSGKRDNVELARLDAKRDYVSVEDIASAFRIIVEGEPQENVYNVGSGYSTTNGELLELILKNSKLDSRPQIKETSSDPEPLVAVCADISRISDEFGWHSKRNIDEIVGEIVNGEDEE